MISNPLPVFTPCSAMHWTICCVRVRCPGFPDLGVQFKPESWHTPNPIAARTFFMRHMIAPHHGAVDGSPGQDCRASGIPLNCRHPPLFRLRAQDLRVFFRDNGEYLEISSAESQGRSPLNCSTRCPKDPVHPLRERPFRCFRIPSEFLADDVEKLSAAPWQAGVATDTWLYRVNNEDRVFVDEAAGIFRVVDGIGGRAGGEQAAEIAVRVITGHLANSTGAPEDRVRQSIATANNEIYHLAHLHEE